MDAGLYRNGLLFERDTCCNPCDPCFNWCNAWSFRMGFYGDYVFDRHMELDTRDYADVDDTMLFTNAGYLALNICNRFDIFATFGATNIDVYANPVIFGLVTNSKIELVSETDFSWSVGGRLTIWNFNCFYFGIEGQYFYTKPNLNIARVEGVFVEYPDDHVEMKYSEWQVGIGASYLLRAACSGVSAIPYIGVKWAGNELNFHNAVLGPVDNQVTLFKLENKKLWGYAAGLTLTFCEALGATVEGRWGDEKGVHVNMQLRF
jgi:major outer membrane protein